MSEIERVDFRPATFDDSDFLGDMLNMSFAWGETEEVPDFDVFKCCYPIETRAYLEGFGYRKDDVGVIAELTNNPVGAAWARHIDRTPPYDGELIPGHSFEVAIAVHPEVRRRGIGARLLNHLSEMATVQGNEYLMLGVKEDNIIAKRLYEKCGFVVNKDESGKEVRVHGITVPMIKSLVK